MRLFVLLFLIVLITPAFASDKFASPDVGEYFRTLKQPDNPTVSCCGSSDAFYADRTEACKDTDGPDCAVVAIITDTRGDTLTLEDGTKVERIHVLPGTRVVVPRAKIRKHPIPNPTDHNIVFIGANDYEGGYFAFCWEPATLI